MTWKVVLRNMKELRFGYDRTLPMQGDAALNADSAVSGVEKKIAFVDEDGVVHTDTIWVPPQRSQGTRQPTPRTKGHCRGYLVDPIRNRAIGFSSTHEMRCALILLADPEVVLLEDQPPAVSYLGADEKYHTHTFDYRATYRCGKRVAIAVKPLRQVEKSGVRNVIKRLRPVLGPFGNTAVILTDHHLTKARAWNAASTLRALRCKNAADCLRILEFLKATDGILNTYEIAEHFDDYAAAMNAIWCLIYERVLIPMRPDKKLCDAPFVQVSPSIAQPQRQVRAQRIAA